jgi:hypothetical protein
MQHEHLKSAALLTFRRVPRSGGFLASVADHQALSRFPARMVAVAVVFLRTVLIGMRRLGT